jgi:hypothetical protein
VLPQRHFAGALRVNASRSQDFIVERRDGRAGEHYRADRRMTASELIALLDSYLRGDEDFRQSTWWHRVRVDFGATKARV